MHYKRLAHGLVTTGSLISTDSDLNKHITDIHTDWYTSIYEYNEEQYKEFQKVGSVKGVFDVTATQLTWDLDDKDDLERARQDALSLCRIIQSLNVPKNGFRIAFSGKKGFEVTLFLDDRIDVPQYKTAWKKLAGHLGTNDSKVTNPSRLIRIVNTKHPDTGKYKVPLTFDELSTSVENILELAKAPREIASHWGRLKLPPYYFQVEKKDALTTNTKGFDLTNKPKFLTNCRYALQKGFFDVGNRSFSFLCLASTYKNLGFDLEHVYRLLKGVAELQAQKNSCQRYEDDKLYNEVVMQVFSPGWKGGQFSCRDKDNWLYTFCQSLGDHTCNHATEDELEPKKFSDIHDSFKEYVTNIDKNTIYTGLPSVDKHVFLSTGCNASIIGASGSGKTSIGIELLNNTSKQGVISVCASLDMAKNRIFEKILYRLTGLDRDTLYATFRENKEGAIMEQLKQEFGNVYFFKKTCPTVADIKDYIMNVQDKTGEKVKLLVTDYFERIVCDISDDTASSKRVAGELQDLVDDLDICNITLVQPNKMALSGGPDSPIYDYTNIKGSSFLYQSFRIIMSCWRPFYHPKDFSKDHFMKMAVLKNDLGELAEMEFRWEGKRGLITELEDYERDELREMLAQKDDARNMAGKANGRF